MRSFIKTIKISVYSSMANLLTKLRIDYSSLTMLQDVKTPPTAETKQLHNKLLHGFNEGENNECFISNIERQTLQEKTNRQLRLRELLLEHSCNASLIVMSLPMPRQGAVSAPLYMSWLEILSKDMPPFLFIRGNQSSVLTYYSWITCIAIEASIGNVENIIEIE